MQYVTFLTEEFHDSGIIGALPQQFSRRHCRICAVNLRDMRTTEQIFGIQTALQPVVIKQKQPHFSGIVAVHVFLRFRLQIGFQYLQALMTML
jgi:hypothetical protein